MSILFEPVIAPNLATAFMIKASNDLFQDPSFEAEIDTLKASTTSHDEVGATVALRSMLHASHQLSSQSEAVLVADTKTRSGVDANFKSLTDVLGTEAVELILKQPSLRLKMPAEVKSDLRLWRFHDQSYLLQVISHDAEFGRFCGLCLDDPQLLESMDMRHRKSHEGQPLSAAGLSYIRRALTQSQTALFPLTQDELLIFIGKQSINEKSWIPGYQVTDIYGKVLTPEDLLKMSIA